MLTSFSLDAQYAVDFLNPLVWEKSRREVSGGVCVCVCAAAAERWWCISAATAERLFLLWTSSDRGNGGGRERAEGRKRRQRRGGRNGRDSAVMAVAELSRSACGGVKKSQHLTHLPLCRSAFLLITPPPPQPRSTAQYLH